jgi:hypothetical protein
VYGGRSVFNVCKAYVTYTYIHYIHVHTKAISMENQEIERGQPSQSIDGGEGQGPGGALPAHRLGCDYLQENDFVISLSCARMIGPDFRSVSIAASEMLERAAFHIMGVQHTRMQKPMCRVSSLILVSAGKDRLKPQPCD